MVVLFSWSDRLFVQDRIRQNMIKSCSRNLKHRTCVKIPIASTALGRSSPSLITSRVARMESNVLRLESFKRSVRLPDSASTYRKTIANCSRLLQSFVSSASMEYMPAFWTSAQIRFRTRFPITFNSAFCMSGDVYVAFLGPQLILWRTMGSCLASNCNISRKFPLFADSTDSLWSRSAMSCLLPRSKISETVLM